MEKWILVLDSGIGGLYTLKILQKKMPTENFLFFMDKMHSPYGNKPANKLNKLVCDNVKKVRAMFEIKAIVLACNTASAVCYETIKAQNADLPTFKIQPYVDIKKFEDKPTLVMVTKNTARHCAELAKIESKKNVFLMSFGKLARQIDKTNGNFDMLLPFLRKKMCKYSHMNIQNIVLGCTHFNHIKPQLRTIFGDVKFFESSPKVANECKKVLRKNHLLKKSGNGRTIIFCKV